jgi:hypothetical protein
MNGDSACGAHPGGWPTLALIFRQHQRKTTERKANILNSQSIGSTATVKLTYYSSTLYFRQCAMHQMDRDRTLANG